MKAWLNLDWSERDVAETRVWVQLDETRMLRLNGDGTYCVEKWSDLPFILDADENWRSLA